MDTKKGIIAFIVFLILAVVLSVLILPVFKIKIVNITGNDNITEEQIMAIIPGAIGSNMLAFNSKKTAEEIKSSYHYAREITIKKHFPSQIDIDVAEYKLRAYVPYMGNYLYIDGDGRILDIQKDITQQLPVVEGLNFTEFTLGEKLAVQNSGAFSTVVQLSKLFDKYDFAGNVVKVDVSDITNIHLYVGKVDIVFGDFTDANEKLVKIIEILKQLDTSYPGVLNITESGGSFEYLT